MLCWYQAAGLLRRSGFTKLIAKAITRNVRVSFFFRFLLWAGAGATVLTMANSKKDVALLTAVFLLGLGALETVLALIGA